MEERMSQYRGQYTEEEKVIIDAARKRTLELLSQTTNLEAAKELGTLLTMMVGEFVGPGILEPTDINIIFTAVNEVILKGTDIAKKKHPELFSNPTQIN
jgi:hypothetical protein